MFLVLYFLAVVILEVVPGVASLSRLIWCFSGYLELILGVIGANLMGDRDCLMDGLGT